MSETDLHIFETINKDKYFVMCVFKWIMDYICSSFLLVFILSLCWSHKFVPTTHTF